MKAFIENSQQPERAVLVGVDFGRFDPEQSLDELEELAKTAGAEVIGRMTQKRDKPDTATFIGSGKLEELKEFCKGNEVDLLLVDDELTPSQARNIEDAVDVRVVDRTTLILDIFAARAISGEGKLQVELAQLKYSLPRLTGKGASLSRLGGGIGTRGPGETKLESDRRHIRRRIASLEEQLIELEKRRGSLRTRRAKDGVQTVAIVGYTNAGKSTLMNTLTQAGVLAEDKLFATLDPTSRGLDLPDGRRVMLIDTVGLIRRLPHHLVEAFKSTLEEAVDATVILNVCDASSPECAEHLRVTSDLLTSLNCMDKPIISVMNKCDLVPSLTDLPTIGRSVMISAKTGEGLERLLDAIVRELPQTRRQAKLLLPYAATAAAARFRTEGKLLSEEYTPDGILLEVIAEIRLLNEFQDYIME
ncbi:MAG TPA: GTPase HflX [Ruminococcaceae bacterium]|nr:GTPase HflX [Oscillospiraceae bacterium]